MNKNPVKLSPAFKDYLWGGERLKKEYGKITDMIPLAESWEMSVHKDGESTVCSGEYSGLPLSQYIEKNGKGILGTRAERFDYFPLLIKFIDAKKSLSVQVHPTDEYALKNEGEYGKTEMWYVLDCEKDSFIYYGFSKDVTLEEFRSAINEGRLTDILNKEPVHKGDVFFIPSGTLHAIGEGIVICEIQQNSNSTYRVFDYNRRDKNGNLRPLHIEKALAVTNLTRPPEVKKIPDADDALLASCSYFEVRKLTVKGKKEINADTESFISLICVEGEGTLDFDCGSLEFKKGDSIFVPADNRKLKVSGNCQLISSVVGK